MFIGERVALIEAGFLAEARGSDTVPIEAGGFY